MSRDDHVIDAPDPVGSALMELQLAILRHPVAAQAIFSSLVAEGRRYTESADGRALAAKVAKSDLAQRGRVVWDVLTMSALTDGDDVIPSVVLDAFMESIDNDRLEPWLSSLFEQNTDG